VKSKFNVDIRNRRFRRPVVKDYLHTLNLVSLADLVSVVLWVLDENIKIVLKCNE
jgi:hypothetical protein